MRLDLVTVVVEDYDAAIEFFTRRLGFDLVEDSPATTNDGRPKRWVVVRPSGAQTGVLLARADGERQRAAVGDQVAGRVGFFLRVDDVGAAHARLSAAGVRFVAPPRTESYGRVAVFLVPQPSAGRCPQSPATGGTWWARPEARPTVSAAGQCRRSVPTVGPRRPGPRGCRGRPARSTVSDVPGRNEPSTMSAAE